MRDRSADNRVVDDPFDCHRIERRLVQRAVDALQLNAADGVERDDVALHDDARNELLGVEFDRGFAGTARSLGVSLPATSCGRVMDEC